MEASGRRRFVGGVAAALLASAPLLAETNADSVDPQPGEHPRKPSNEDIENQLMSLANQLSDLDQKLALAGPIQEQLATLRDEVEAISVRLNKTEPLIASRIQQMENTIAEMKRGSESLVPLIG